MKITLNRANNNYHFELKNERGHIVNVDNKAAFGGDDLGASPMELVLMGVAGCSAIDIISILRVFSEANLSILVIDSYFILSNESLALDINSLRNISLLE